MVKSYQGQIKIGLLTEIQQLITLARQHHRNIVRVIVGNETLLREEADVEQPVELRTVRSIVISTPENGVTRTFSGTAKANNETFEESIIQ